MNATSIASGEAATLLSVEQLKVQFGVPRGAYPWSGKTMLRAVDGVSFNVRRGETVGLVGESGCGKSTLARAIIGLAPVASGSVRWLGNETVLPAARRDTTLLRRDVQMIFQDPLASLDPRMTIEQIVAEPLIAHGRNLARADVQRRVLTMLERVGIARALISEPQLVICDEPVSALDVSIQAQIVNLLRDLQRELSLSLLFVAHDLAVVKAISHRVLVMYLGRVMEFGDKRDVYRTPLHPYTRALLSAVPVPDPTVERARRHLLLRGEIASPLNPPSGCAFRTRCPDAIDACAAQIPQPVTHGASATRVACIRVGDG